MRHLDLGSARLTDVTLRKASDSVVISLALLCRAMHQDVPESGGHVLSEVDPVRWGPPGAHHLKGRIRP
ncbi:MAG TPA: hypothetical protein VI248_15665 [Kineosporiaceae bacterium]